jgi:hypothetical protein
MSYTSLQFIANDTNTSDATWRTWCAAISAALLASGFVQQNDTGQGVFVACVATLTQATVSGGNVVYSYSGTPTGPPIRIGMSMVITGFVNGGNNGTFTITALGAGTFTVVNGGGVNETHAGSATTTPSTRPGANLYVYEIWCPADALQTGSTAYYLKMEYGGANSSYTRHSVGTGTNGAGTLTGFFTATQFGSNSGSASTVPYDCYFSGDTGRFGYAMFRGISNNSQASFFFYVERTTNIDGTYNGEGVTIWSGSGSNWNQCTLVFGVGAAAAYTRAVGLTDGGTSGALSSTSGAFNNTIPIVLANSKYGKWGNFCTVVGWVHSADVAEGCLITATVYGVSHVYMASNNLGGSAGPAGNSRMLFRYD